jgi:hypothetical protein
MRYFCARILPVHPAIPEVARFSDPDFYDSGARVLLIPRSPTTPWIPGTLNGATDSGVSNVGDTSGSFYKRSQSPTTIGLRQRACLLLHRLESLTAVLC